MSINNSPNYYLSFNEGKRSCYSTLKTYEPPIRILLREAINTERLLSLSKEHNVPIRKISGIIYDYIIWRELERRQLSAQSVNYDNLYIDLEKYLENK